MKKIAKGIRPEVNTDEMTVTMRVKEKDEVLQEEEFHWEPLPEEIKTRLMLHGLNTILQQRTSDIKEDPESKVDAMVDVYDRFLSGEWAKERVVGSRTVPAIVEVLAELKGCEVGQAQKAWSKLDDDTKKAFKDKYAAQVEAKEAARKDREVDLSDLI